MLIIQRVLTVPVDRTMTDSDKPDTPKPEANPSGTPEKSCQVSCRNPLVISVALIAIVLVATAGFLALYHPAVAKIGDNVSVYYTITLNDGSIYQTNFNSTLPLTFTLGDPGVIPGFTEAVEGMSVGQVKTVKIPAAKAFGEYNSSLIHTVEKSNFAQTNFSVGQSYYVVNHQTGAMSEIKILNVTNDTVTWDANSPLAGKDLTCVIKLDAVGNP